VADINGVVCIPQSMAEKALDLIQSQVDADEKVAADIQKGRSVAEAMKEHRANVKQP
jgi:regulator of RNase E activity RraA